MNHAEPVPFDADLTAYQEQAKRLFDLYKSGDAAACWHIKWEHPAFRDKSGKDVMAAALDLADAQLVVAHEYGFETWQDLTAFTNAIKHDSVLREFELAVEAVISGDVASLRRMLQQNPELVRARSTRRHHATLLHYIAANGVEGMRQKTPANALEVAQTLLDAGAQVDALADMYDAQCTTLSMLVSSTPPHEAGLQAALAELLLDHGAALNGPGSNWQSALLTALTFGYLDTARSLAQRYSSFDDITATAGLGLLEETKRLLAGAVGQSRHAAMALAAQHGQTAVLDLLLDAREDPDRYNPDGFHSHATALHNAVSSNQEGVVRLLVERGARTDIKDTIYDGTPLDWSNYLERTAIADYLRTRA